jgi:hypothetical protein
MLNYLSCETGDDVKSVDRNRQISCEFNPTAFYQMALSAALAALFFKGEKAPKFKCQINCAEVIYIYVRIRSSLITQMLHIAEGGDISDFFGTHFV